MPNVQNLNSKATTLSMVNETPWQVKVGRPTDAASRTSRLPVQTETGPGNDSGLSTPLLPPFEKSDSSWRYIVALLKLISCNSTNVLMIYAMSENN